MCSVSSQICDSQNEQVFFAQMTSCAMHYDITYYTFPINSQYLKMAGGGGGGGGSPAAKLKIQK